MNLFSTTSVKQPLPVPPINTYSVTDGDFVPMPGPVDTAHTTYGKPVEPTLVDLVSSLHTVAFTQQITKKKDEEEAPAEEDIAADVPARLRVRDVPARLRHATGDRNRYSTGGRNLPAHPRAPREEDAPD
jgi:hypothetical protein